MNERFSLGNIHESQTEDPAKKEGALQEKVAEVINQWKEAGYDTVAIRTTDGSLYPCMEEDIPSGAIDAYYPIDNNDIKEALIQSIEGGWNY